MDDKEIEAAFDRWLNSGNGPSFEGDFQFSAFKSGAKLILLENKKLTVCQCSEMDTEFGIHCNSCVKDKLEKLQAENEKLKKYIIDQDICVCDNQHQYICEKCEILEGL